MQDHQLLQPAVAAARRPPATVWQPSGLQRAANRRLGHPRGGVEDVHGECRKQLEVAPRYFFLQLSPKIAPSCESSAKGAWGAGAGYQSNSSFASSARNAVRSHTCRRRMSTLTATLSPSGLRASGSIPAGNISNGSKVRAS